MDSFFAILKKSLVATIFIIFAFVGTYIPQDWNKVEVAHAGGAGGYTIPQGALAFIQQQATNVQSTLSAGYNAITSFASNYLFLKESVLDGIAWAIAKSIISSMVNSLVNWINSGFQGSPAFVQDISGFLLNAADVGIGRYLEELGGIGSFICSPFRLDVQIAVALQYQRTRVDQTAPTCTLTGVFDNIEGFLEGTQGSFTENGGWESWFNITSKPQTYTPYGAILSAQEGARLRILNEEGEARAELDFGNGFLSGKICQAVSGSSYEDCSISKPGKVIVESLNEHLGAGLGSLIAADEINEILAALLGQLANQAITGAAGLLGLSGGTGHTVPQPGGLSYIDALVIEAADQVDSSGTLSGVQEVLATQIQYNNLANQYVPFLTDYANTPGRTAADRAAANAAISDANTIISNTDSYINRLNSMIAEFNNGNTTDARKAELASEFASISFYTQPAITASRSTWDNILARNAGSSDVDTDPREVIDRMEAARDTQISYRNLANEYRPDLLLYAQNPANDPIRRSDASRAASDASIIIQNTGNYISEISDFLARFTDPEVSSIEQDEIVVDFVRLTLYTESNISASREAWDAIMTPIDFGNTATLLQDALTTETEYYNLANTYIPMLGAFPTALADANNILADTGANMTTLTGMISTFNSPSATEGQKSQIVDNFRLMVLSTNAAIINSRNDWNALLTP